MIASVGRRISLIWIWHRVLLRSAAFRIARAPATRLKGEIRRGASAGERSRRRASGVTKEREAAQNVGPTKGSAPPQPRPPAGAELHIGCVHGSIQWGSMPADLDRGGIIEGMRAIRLLSAAFLLLNAVVVGSFASPAEPVIELESRWGRRSLRSLLSGKLDRGR